jgi:phospholipase/lecithinase/hemolysin
MAALSIDAGRSSTGSSPVCVAQARHALRHRNGADIDQVGLGRAPWAGRRLRIELNQPVTSRRVYAAVAISHQLEGNEVSKLSRILGSIAMVLIPVLCGLHTQAQAGPFSSVVVYGDSLSDNGNFFAATGQPPSPPYSAGRRSNGPVAVEQVAATLGVPLIDFAWIGATTGIGNYADGGTATTLGTHGLPGMQTMFGATQGSLAPYLADGLFVVWGGPNDFLSPSPLDTTPAAIIQRAVQNILGIVTGLEGLGAQHILVPGMPDLGLSPYFQGMGPAAAAQGSALTDVFNAALRLSLPNDVDFYDTSALLRSMVANPGDYGFTNVRDPCFNGVNICADPSAYLYFDDFHPTTAAASFVAQGFLATVLPEPSTIVLVLSALWLGAATRVPARRQQPAWSA